jgi:hypothetical protein
MSSLEPKTIFPHKAKIRWKFYIFFNSNFGEIFFWQLQGQIIYFWYFTGQDIFWSQNYKNKNNITLPWKLIDGPVWDISESEVISKFLYIWQNCLNVKLEAKTQVHQTWNVFTRTINWRVRVSSRYVIYFGIFTVYANLDAPYPNHILIGNKNSIQFQLKSLFVVYLPTSETKRTFIYTIYVKYTIKKCILDGDRNINTNVVISNEVICWCH